MILPTCLRNISRFPAFLLLATLSLLSSCAQEKLVWDLAKVPVVRTSSPTEIRHSSFRITAQVEGNVKLKEKGFCIAHTPNPTIKENRFLVDSGSAAYSGLLKNLWADTLYYVRAYASNATGTGYGNAVEVKTQAGFCPVLQTIAPVLSNGDKDLASGGNILDDGGYPILAKGICWSDQPGPVAGPGTSSNEGTGRESFTSSIKDLQPGKTYFIRAYATNAKGTCYGEEKRTRLEIPVLSTNVVLNISFNQANSGGNISSDGGSPITSRGVCWSTSPNPNINTSTKTQDSTGTGNFSSLISSLNPGTTYYVRAYAVNAIGTAYGNEVNFKTSITLAGIETSPVTSITTASASCGGSISYDGGSPVTLRGVCWSVSPNPTTTLSTKTSNGSGIGSFTSSLTNLQSNKTYYVRAYATNSAGTVYGNDITFITTPITIATLTTTLVTGITNNTASSGGSITSAGGGTITAKGICWSTNPNPTIALSTKTNNGNNSASFISSLTGLIYGTTYYVRAYATNIAGTGYGNQLIFTTSGISDIDGNFYETITIGTQVWMKQNLKVVKYRNGDPIPTNLDSAAWMSTTSGAYVTYNNTTYGKLYNWYAVTDSRGLCPLGWHIPSDTECELLMNFCGGSPVAGGKLKAVSSLWASPNTGATNSSLFSALPGGYRYNVYSSAGTYGFWWSSTVGWTTTGVGYGFYLSHNNNAYTGINYGKSAGLSVRCLKD